MTTRTRPARGVRSQRAKPPARWPLVVVAVVIVLALVALLARDRDGGSGADVSAGEHVAVAHVHGLGVDPADGMLYAATHFGLFRIPENGKASRVGDNQQDTMGFTVVGAGHFFASGHPDASDESLRRPGKPPLLGLIESKDAGKRWKPLSLLGEADFHSLVAAHGNVYGFDSTGGRFMVSADGRSWDTRSDVPLITFAVDPADADRIVAMTERGLAESRDGGRSFDSLDGGPLVFLSWNAEQGLWGVSPTGDTYEHTSGGWQRREPLGGQPQALLVTDGALYAAVAIRDLTQIVVSRDDGRTWTTRYRETAP